VLLSAMIILLNRYLSRHAPRSLFFPALPLVVLLLPFLFAYSISALLGLALGVPLLLLLNRATAVRKTALLVFIAVVVLNVMALTPLYYGRISWLERKLSDPTQSEGRSIKWRECMDVSRSSPLFGVGYGKFGGILQPESGFILENIVDNSYVLLLTQYGLIGFGLFCGLLMSIFRQGLRAWKTARDPQIKETVSAIFTLLAVYCVIAFPLNLWEMMFPINFLFWLCAGILFKLPEMETKSLSEK